MVVTNLDPRSQVLADHYEAAVTKFERLSLIDYGVAKFHADIDLRPTASIWVSGDGPKRLIPGFSLSGITLTVRSLHGRGSCGIRLR